MITGAKILSKIFNKQVWLSQGCKGFSISANQSIWYTTLTNKNEKHIIISIDAENAFGKSQHSFVIETLWKVGIEETHLKEGHLNKHM